MSNKATKKLCFVVGPIGSEDSETRIHADWLLEEIIQPVLLEFPDYEVKRADQDPRPGLIDAQLINDLLTADLVNVKNSIQSKPSNPIVRIKRHRFCVANNFGSRSFNL